MKYILFKDGRIRLFDHEQMHSNLAGDRNTVLSAGFFNVAIGYEPVLNDPFISVHVYGESTTLQIKSRPEDEKIIKHFLTKGI